MVKGLIGTGLGSESCDDTMPFTANEPTIHPNTSLQTLGYYPNEAELWHFLDYSGQGHRLSAVLPR